MKQWKHILGNQNEKEIVCYEASGMAFETIFEIFLFKRRFGIQREKERKKLWERDYEMAYLKDWQVVVELAFAVVFLTNKQSGSLFVGMELEFWKMSVGNLGGKRKSSEKRVAL